MYPDDDEDEDQQSDDTSDVVVGGGTEPDKGGVAAAISEPQAGGGVPDKEALRQLLYSNLTAQLKNPSTNLALQKNIGDENRQNALLASLQKSSNQMGSINGRVAGDAGVSDMAKNIANDSAQELGQANTEEQRKNMLQQYLLGQIQKSDMMDAMTKQRAAALQQNMDLKKLNLSEKVRADQANEDLKSQLVDIRGNQAGQKNDITRKDWAKLDENLSKGSNNSRSGLLGDQQKVLAQADHVKALADQADPKQGLPPALMGEMVMSTARMLSPGGVISDHTLNLLMPNTEGSAEARIQQWLTNNPTPAANMAFVNQLSDMADRQAFTANELVRNVKAEELQDAKLQGYQDADPKAYQQRVNRHIPNAQFDQNGTYIKQKYGNPVSQAPGLRDSNAAMAAAQGAPLDPKIQSYAKQYNLDYDTASGVLKSRGYNAGQ